MTDMEYDEKYQREGKVPALIRKGILEKSKPSERMGRKARGLKQRRQASPAARISFLVKERLKKRQRRSYKRSSLC